MIKTRILGQIRHLRRIIVLFADQRGQRRNMKAPYVAGLTGFGGHGGLCILAGIFNRLEHR